MKPRLSRAFSLLELLLVLGLIAALSFLLLAGLGDGGRGAALPSAQATLASLITAARSQAVASNRKTRILVNADPSQPERYLRYLVLQQARQPGASPVDWDAVTTLTLPGKVYVVPADLTGLVSPSEDWTRGSDSTKNLASDLFSTQSLQVLLEGDATAQTWLGVAFTPNHTLAAVVSGPPPKGAIVLALGRVRPVGTYTLGQPPVELEQPRRVRGILLSAYGVPALLADREAF